MKTNKQAYVKSKATNPEYSMEPLFTKYCTIPLKSQRRLMCTCNKTRQNEALFDHCSVWTLLCRLELKKR